MSASTPVEPVEVTVSPLRRWLRGHPRLRGVALDLVAFGRMLRRPRKLIATIRYRLRLGHCGRDVDFESDMIVRNPGRISIGDRCSFSPFVVLDAHDRIAIGDDCMFATRVTVSTATHDYTVEPMNRKVITRPVTIESGVWLGVGATILPGVRIGRGAVVGAHALVTKDVPPYAIVLGVPARVVRYRDVPQEGP